MDEFVTDVFVTRNDQLACAAAKFVRHPEGGATTIEVALEV